MQLLDCGHTNEHKTDFAPGYAVYEDRRICYDCTAHIELSDMCRTGKGVMYIKTDCEKDCAYVTNWTGLNKRRIQRIRTGHHNIAKYQVHFWFKLGGFVWHGIQWTHSRGLDNGMYCRVYRTKQTEL